MRNAKTTHRRGAALALALAGLLLLSAGLQAAEPSPAKGPLDLNSATLAQIQTLPIPADVALAIYDYRTYVRYFDNIYDLMEVDGMTPALLERLKPLVATLPPTPADASIARLWESYRQVRSFLGQEGTSEGLVDEYLDQLREPVDINELDLFDLMSYQNVSPVDATDILKARQRLGGFESARQLRSTEGLRYWAYRNLRDFVTYGPPEEPAAGLQQVHGSYEVRYYDTPYMSDDEDLISGYTPPHPPQPPQPLLRGPFDPSMTHKLRLDSSGGIKGGLLTHRDLGERSWHETTKGYLGIQDKDLGAFHLKRLVLGNFRVAFGQGLVMDNTDFVLFRKTGFGWNKRPVGVRGDLSRTREFALTGGAVEGQLGPVYGTLFVSTGRKDGILNKDGTANQYILMYPRLSEEDLSRLNTVPEYAAGGLLQREAFKEDIVGGNFKLMLAPGSYVGVTGYEARYDRGFRADVDALIASDATGLLEARDSEIYQGYTSVFVDPVTGLRKEYKFRRVFGTEFQTVYRNCSLQGEYAWLQDPRRPFLKGDMGDAFIVNGYAQWNDLDLLAIYRDYDVGFDNPYNRAFSNDARYEQTLLDSDYRLNNPFFSWLAFNTPQPKPEKGLFLETRYRISRQLTITGLQYDQWERKADGMDMRRWTLKAEYQPIFNLRLRVRQRYSSRSEQLPEDVRTFRSWETRWELHALLSNYSRLKFLYMTSNVFFPPRSRLSYPAESSPPGTSETVHSGLGTAGMPAHAFQALYEHNLTSWIRLLLSTEIYDGFLWNFEGNEFILLDGKGFRNWFKVESRVSEHLMFQLKVTRDHNLPGTYLDIRNYDEAMGFDPEGRYQPLDWTTYRLQMDYTF